jgi:Kef-type K+ transport system membrane component KefB
VTLLAAGGLSSEDLLVFWVGLAALLAVAHLLGALARRLGQPSVVGELTAGIVLGPSLLGRLAPGVQEWMFSDDPARYGMLMAVSWIGVVLLLVVTGFETDLKLLRRLGSASAAVTIGSLIVPLAGGAALGMVLPDLFLGATDQRGQFILFIAVALSISALPVIAKVLFDLQLMRRDLGQITIAAGMTNDLIGWVLLGVVAGLAATDGFSLATLVRSVGGLALFVVFAFTAGQRIVDRLLRRVRDRTSSQASVLATFVTIALTAGVVTQWLGVEAVIGAFVAGILLGRSRYADRNTEHALENVTHGFFAPIFFATAGLSVDLTLLATPSGLLWTLAIIGMAALTKFVGAFVGGRIGGMNVRHATALGAALNARGAMEIVIATIGLGLGVLNDTSYAAIVVMALVTSLVAGPAIKLILRGERIEGPESERLEREARLAGSIIGASRALLPTRGGANSVAAARILDWILQPESFVTVVTVSDPADVTDDGSKARGTAATAVSGLFREHSVDSVDRLGTDPAAAILSETRLGYDLIAVGMTHGEDGAGLSRTLERVLAGSPVPVLLVSQGPRAMLVNHEIRRIVVPATGTRVGRAAQEVAFALAGSLNAEVDAVHVVADELPVGVSATGPTSLMGVEALEDSADIAASFGRTASLYWAQGTMPARELLDRAESSGAELVVAGVELSKTEDRVFLGYNAEYLLRYAPQTVALIVYPV